MIRVLEDFVPLVEVVRSDGTVTRVVAADLSDAGAEELCEAFRRYLGASAVVRVARIVRVEVLGAPVHA